MEHWKRNYIILWIGQAVSVLTSSVLQMALIWHLTAGTHSAWVLSMASVAGFLPNAVLGIAAGTVVDRIRRKTAMIAADLFIAAVSLFLVAASLSGELPVWLVLTVLAARSVGTAFHTPAINAAAPLIVPPEALVKCAGYTQSLQVIGFMIGTAAAGVLYSVWSMTQLVMLDVFGALFACAAVLLIRIPESVQEKADAKKRDLLSEMKEGYCVLKREKGLYALLFTAAVFMILYSPVNALFPLMSLDYFGGTTAQAAAAEIAFSAGMLAGGMLIGAFGGFRKRGFGIAFSVALMGLSIAASGLLPADAFSGFAVLCVLMGASVPFYNAPVTATMQERIAPEYLGRVFGLYGSISSLAMPVGLLFSGLFADRVGVNIWFCITGILCAALAAVMYLIPAIREI